MNQTSKPTSEHDWIVHSINIHGIFFERSCQRAIASTDWKLRSVNYPVEFPPPNGPLRGRESTLDIRADLQRGDKLLTLLIECKKNNPDFVNWIFFPKGSSKEENPIVISQIENTPNQPPVVGWGVQTSLKPISVSLPIADEARETRSSYLQHHKGEKTKTSNAAIVDAAHQIALATQAIVLEEAHFSRALGSSKSPSSMPWKKQVLLPMIVTSARIFVCNFDPSHVDPATGEIPYTKATIEELPSLFFEYPLPRHLQNAPADIAATLTNNSMELFMRKHIVIVHGGKFVDILRSFASKGEQFFS